MRELPLTLLRFGLLALLWIFVLSAVRVIRSDLFRSPQVAPPEPLSARQPAPVTDRPSRRESSAEANSQARHLVVTSGPLAGTTVRLADTAITLGRGDTCTLVLGDDYVSTEHARLAPAGDRWLLADLGSTNGTFLAERKVSDPTPVPLGTPIRVGRTELELRR